jgi:putative membrane protein
MTGYYLWLKAAHLLSIMAWVMGLLYLPRLFAHHAQVPVASEAAEQFKEMERQLLKALINPAGFLVFATGLWLMVAGHWSSSGWVHTKILLALVLGGLHGMMSKQRKNLEQGQNQRSPAYFRLLSAIAAVVVVALVLLAALKPF